MSKEIRVLYVEDDEMSRKVIKFLLTREIGLSDIILWENSSDFLNRVSQLDPKPDVIFLDIHIEPIDGFKMLEILRSNATFDDIPIIALTASVMNAEVQKLKGHGFDGAIGKPINQEIFEIIFNKILNGESIWSIRH